jgi:hypothetical protein
MNATRLAATAALLTLAGCSYSYRNPAEQLGPGEVGGRTVAGVEVLIDGVSVSVQGAALDATSRANGRFSMLPLPVGRHSLMFRKGRERALQREVEIAYGSDGQPQGLWLGDVTVPAAVTLSGSGEADDGALLASNGVAVDEVSGAVVPFSGGFSFEGLSIGAHRIRIFVTDEDQRAYVGGPAEVVLQPSDAGTQKTMTRISLHRAGPPAETGLVKLKFGVSGSIPGLKLSDLKLEGLPGTVGFGSDGVAQVDLPEGVFTVAVKLPAGLPVGVTPPPRKTFVAIKGRTLDLGTLYAVTDPAQSQAERSCRSDADCAPGTCTSSHVCDAGYQPPAQAPSNVPWCDPDSSGCTVGAYGGVYNGKPPTYYGPPYASTCVGYADGAASVAVACGSSCTPDGVTVLEGTADRAGCQPFIPLVLTPLTGYSASGYNLPSVQFTVSGGTPPYHWVADVGWLSVSTDTNSASWNDFDSGDSVGDYRVIVTDSAPTPQSKIATVHVVGPPAVLSTVPASGAFDVPLDTLISATFDRQLDRATVNDQVMEVLSNGFNISGAVTLDAAGTTITFRPALPLDPNAGITVRFLFQRALDVLGYPVNTNQWKFTTVNPPPPPPPPAPRIALPRTGALLPFHAGDDASNVTGVAWPYPRFADPGTTTPVTGPVALDRLTGLVWLSDNRADFAGLTCAAVATPVIMVTWSDALKLVDCLNAATYLGFTDWRLPNVLELDSLTVAARDLPSGHPFSWTGYLEYWSSTAFVDPINGFMAWTVDAAGSSRSLPDYYTFVVWPVRGGTPVGPDPSFPANLHRTGARSQAPGDDGALHFGVTDPEPRFVAGKDTGGQPCATVDLLTGLTWMADVVPGTTNWSGALAAAGGTFCGHADWRLPNRAELISLLDYATGSSVAPLAAAGLSNTGGTSVSQLVWSSTFQYWGDGNASFAVELTTNEVLGTTMNYTAYTWLVRGGLPPAPVTIASVAVTTPSTTMTMQGATQPTMACTALVTYSDNSIRDVTTLATWNSSNPVSITVDSTGMLAATNQAGSSTITAAVGNVVSPGVDITYIIP